MLGWKWQACAIRGRNFVRENISDYLDKILLHGGDPHLCWRVPFFQLALLTSQELAKFDGNNDNENKVSASSNKTGFGNSVNPFFWLRKKEGQAYVAAGGKIFDVTNSEAFDGNSENGMYAKFAGRDATWALIRMSMDERDIGVIVDEKLLSPKERASLQSWMQYFREKYEVVGVLEGWESKPNYMKHSKDLKHEEMGKLTVGQEEAKQLERNFHKEYKLVG